MLKPDIIESLEKQRDIELKERKEKRQKETEEEEKKKVLRHGRMSSRACVRAKKTFV